MFANLNNSNLSEGRNTIHLESKSRISQDSHLGHVLKIQKRLFTSNSAVNLNKTSPGFSATKSSSNLLSSLAKATPKTDSFNATRPNNSRNFRNIINELTFINYGSTPSKLHETKQNTQRLFGANIPSTPLNPLRNAIKPQDSPRKPTLETPNSPKNDGLRDFEVIARKIRSVEKRLGGGGSEGGT
jgi:hypothetical protein